VFSIIPVGGQRECIIHNMRIQEGERKSGGRESWTALNTIRRNLYQYLDSFRRLAIRSFDLLLRLFSILLAWNSLQAAFRCSFRSCHSKISGVRL
jgi:hypothetical protein